MDPHILAHVNTASPFDRYPKFKICISELITVVPPQPLIRYPRFTADTELKLGN
jgi:hypothetical protein